MTNLKDINFGLNQYCGPSVLSALTGESTDRCAAVISAVSGRKEIKGVQTAHLMEAFRRLRFDTIKIDSIGRTLYGTLLKLSDNDGFYIVIVPHHFVAIEIINNQIYLVDNHSKSPLLANSSARLSQKVEAVYRITPKAIPKFIRSEIKIERIIQGANFKIDIISHNYYENKNDDTEYHLGHIYFKDDLELEWVIKAILNTKKI